MAQEKTETLRKLQEATILTDDDWADLKRVFTKVNPTFFIQLHEKFPTLTQAELRMLALSKLGLSVKEKGNMLGISPDSVRRTQQRLNKKLGKTEVQIIEELVLSLLPPQKRPQEKSALGKLRVIPLPAEPPMQLCPSPMNPN